MNRRFPAIAAVAAVLILPAHAYYHYVHYSSRTAPFIAQYEKFNAKSVTFFVSDQGPAVFASNDSFGSLLGQVKQALAAWDSVATSDLRVVFGGLESPDQQSNTPGGDVVFADLPPGLLGMGAPVSNGATIVRSTVILANNTNQGAGPTYYEKFFTTAVHEIGHALGLQHTWTSSAMSQDVIRNTSRARPLDADDVAAISLLYGKSNWQADYGSISGRVTYSNGSPVVLASVVAINPTGSAVSALTNPDGTYRIDGIPAGNYYLYAHPLPPDAVAADQTGIRLPVDQNGQTPAAFQPSGAFSTVLYPGTTDVTRAQSISISRGTTEQNRNFNVQARASVSAYDLITYSFLDLTNGTSIYNFTPATTWAQVSPAFISANQAAVQLEVQANSGDTPLPQSATVLGGFSMTSRGAYLYPSPDPFNGRQSVWLALGIPLGAGTGPRHLVLNYGNDLYILPAAVNLVQRATPTVTSVNANSDGTVTVNGANFGGDSRVYFDGLPAFTAAAAASTANAITVTPPPGAAGHTAIVTVYNSDGQNSTLLAQTPPAYTYSSGGVPQILSVSVPSLQAGATAAVDITAQNTHFTDGQVTLGFGSDDIVVQRLWVTGPTTLRANLVVAANATPGPSEISIVSGFHVMSQANGFTIQSSAPAFAAGLAAPVMWLPIANGDPAQQTIYPGSIISIYGSNFGQNPGAMQVTLNDVPVPVIGLANDHVNVAVPANFPTGLTIVKMTVGQTSANPVLMQVDAPPPTILRVANSSGVNYDATHFARAGDVVEIVVSGLDPSVQNNLGRLAIAVSGVAMTPQQVVSLSGGQYQIQFVLTQGFGSTTVPLSVAVDGSSSAPYLLPIR